MLHRRRRSEQGPFPAYVLKQGQGLDEAQLAVALRETTIFVSSVFTQHRLRKGCPCQDLLQPCGHEEAVDSSLEIFNLQSFILVLVLPDDDIARSFKPNTLNVRWTLTRQCNMRFLLNCSGPFTRSAVTVDGDQADRDLNSLLFFVTVHCSAARRWFSMA